MTNRRNALVFNSDQEIACARSACKRLQASTSIKMSKDQRAATAAVLTALEGIGSDTGSDSIPMVPRQMRALHLAVQRQHDQLVAQGESDRRGTALAAFAAILGRLQGWDGWPLADSDIVEFVRLGFGDRHGLQVRSLKFEVAIPDRLTLEVALTDGIVSHNQMSGSQAAQQLGPLWDDFGYTILGRDSDPLLRLWLPQTQQQRNGGDNALAVPLAGEELHDLATRITHAAKACHATALIRNHDDTAWNTRSSPSERPVQMLLLWQS